MTNNANHSGLLRLNLQLFAGEEEAILPDDFKSLPQDEIEQQDIIPEQKEDTPLLDEPQPETPEQPKFKVKFNHEEQELGYDEAVPLIQKGMNYDKMQERLQSLESDPRLAFIEAIAQEQGMDVNQFMDAYHQQQEQERLNELIQNNIPEEYAREMLENRKFRQQYEAKQKEEQAKHQQDKEFADFFQAYPNTKPEEIPKEVWEAQAQGIPLKYAFMQHEYNQLKQQVQVLKQNEENKQKAPGLGVTTHGSDEVAGEDDFLRGFNSI